MSVAGLSFETATSRMGLLGADLLVADAIFKRTEVRFSVRTAARLAGICISEQEEVGASIWGNVAVCRHSNRGIIWMHHTYIAG